MRLQRKIATGILGGEDAYWQKVRRLLGQKAYAYLPVWETSGAVAHDISGKGCDGVITGVTTLSHVLGPTGYRAPYFDGSSSGINMYSALFASLFNGKEGGVAGWFKGDDIWEDGTERHLFYLRSDASNLYSSSKRTDNNTLRSLYTANATAGGVTSRLYPDNWFHYCFRWSDSGDICSVCINGVNRYSGTINTWAGALNSGYARVGSLNGSSSFWKGWYQDLLFFNQYPTDDEIKRLVAYAPNSGLKRISFFGDSISADSAAYLTRWNWYFENEYNSGGVALYNHAVSGHNIMTNMDAQVNAATNDNAHIGIFALGTNDNDAGDMVALQAKVESNIVKFRASNPNAKIYYLNVLPKWTDETGSTEVDKSHIRTAIATACVERNVTCIDPYTIPVITPSDTADGTHLIEAGALKVKTLVLSAVT